MVHYGHSNQLRQAKAMGDYLMVGVHTDGKCFQTHYTHTMKHRIDKHTHTAPRLILRSSQVESDFLSITLRILEILV